MPALLRSLGFATLVLLLGALGCQKQGEVAAASADQSVFAEVYPIRLSEVQEAFSAREKRVRESLGRIGSPPSGLSARERTAAQALFEHADAAGRSRYYADEALRQEAVDRLFEEGRGALRRRVGGSVAYVVQRKKCGEAECGEELARELGSTAGAAAVRVVDRQQEQTLDAHSDAARYLDVYASEFDARHLETLSERSRKLTFASFVAHVRLELYRRELEALLGEEERVRATLQRTQQEYRDALADAELPKPRRAALERRLASAQAAEAALAKEVPGAQAALEQMEERIAGLRQDYQTTLGGLLSALGGAEAPAATAAPPAAARRDRNADIAGAAR